MGVGGGRGVGNRDWLMGISNCSVSEFFTSKFYLLLFLDNTISEMHTKLLDNKKISLKSNLSREVGVGSGEWGSGGVGSEENRSRQFKRNTHCLKGNALNLDLCYSNISKPYPVIFRNPSTY